MSRMKIPILLATLFSLCICSNEAFAGQRHRERRQERRQAKTSATCATCAPAYASVSPGGNQYPNAVTPLGIAGTVEMETVQICDGRRCRFVQRPKVQAPATVQVNAQPSTSTPNIIGASGTKVKSDASDELVGLPQNQGVADSAGLTWYGVFKDKYKLDDNTSAILATNQNRREVERALAEVSKRHMTCNCGCDKCTCPKPEIKSGAKSEGVVAPPAPEAETSIDDEGVSTVMITMSLRPQRSSAAPRIDNRYSIVR